MRRLFPVLAGAVVAFGATATANATTYSNTRLIPPPLTQKIGGSEPAISIDANGTMIMDSLAWLPFEIPSWKGPFGSVPSFFGMFDSDLSVPGNRIALGSEDADIDLGSTGTIHEVGLDIFINPTFRSFQLGVSTTTCKNAAFANCKRQFLDQTGADRPWITSNGSNVWISYHDSRNSSIVRTKVSNDDGVTWSNGGGPVVGQGDITGNSTFNNIEGPIVADPKTGYVYDVFAGGEQQSKCCSANYNNIYVSRSTDGGKHYDGVLVHHEPIFTALQNIFPSLAVDGVTGDVYATWSDGSGIWVSKSTDHGLTWSSEKNVSTTPTSVTPWVAAYNGTVDVGWYRESGSNNLSPSATRNVSAAK